MDKDIPFWKKVSMVAGGIGAILAVMISSWQSLEFLPRWAWYTEVVEVQKFAQDTRKIVLNQEWFRVTSTLREKRAELAIDPRNRFLIEEVTKLEQALNDINSQLRQLDKDN